MRTGRVVHVQRLRKSDFDAISQYFNEEFGFSPTKSQVVAFSLRVSDEWLTTCAASVSKTGDRVPPLPYSAQVFTPRYIDVQVDKIAWEKLSDWSRRLQWSISLVCSIALFHTARKLRS